MCREKLTRYRAADGPAFFTMTAVGLFLVPILAIAYSIPGISPLSVLLIVSVASIALTAVLLRAIKGVMVGYLWSKGHVDRGA